MAENVEEKSRRRRRRKAQEEEVEEAADKSVTASKGRITPGRRTRKEEDTGGNFLTRSLRAMNIYRKGVGDELSKVTWPTPQELRRLSIIVTIVLIVSSLALGALSFRLYGSLYSGFRKRDRLRHHVWCHHPWFRGLYTHGTQ